MNYTINDYYNSPAWANKRNERLKMDNFRCARCGFTRALEVHHLNYDRFGNEDVSRDLITLCKKCHNKIEATKQKINPIEKVEHHFAYLAGKIKPHDWRNQFYDCRTAYMFTLNGTIAHDSVVTVNNKISITGPFFIACDHGCYHGNETHGVGVNREWGGCMGDYFTEDEVVNMCKSQIDRADIIFAYINQHDCYGTIAEIGYAHAKGKDVVIVFSNDELKREMWFVDKMQHRTNNVSNKWIHEQLLSCISNKS